MYWMNSIWLPCKRALNANDFPFPYWHILEVNVTKYNTELNESQRVAQNLFDLIENRN